LKRRPRSSHTLTGTVAQAEIRFSVSTIGPASAASSTLVTVDDMTPAGRW
jgi:hypothetical protein